ncbi:hypothetical protein ACGF0D_43905 [Kitasatospora sp. NPDC048298]|uniref:hypothetical protein n=1 Tax=Kitasatospora sp. NPDC048298 TaxID=3364049 RepID=UPI0037107AD8
MMPQAIKPMIPQLQWCRTDAVRRHGGVVQVGEVVDDAAMVPHRSGAEAQAAGEAYFRVAVALRWSRTEVMRRHWRRQR